MTRQLGNWANPRIDANVVPKTGERINCRGGLPRSDAVVQLSAADQALSYELKILVHKWAALCFACCGAHAQEPLLGQRPRPVRHEKCKLRLRRGRLLLNLLAQRVKAATLVPRFLAAAARGIQSPARLPAGVTPLSSSSRSVVATHTRRAAVAVALGTRFSALRTTALATTRTGLGFCARDAKGTTARFPILGARTRGMVALALTVTGAPRLPIRDTSSTPFGVAGFAGSATGQTFMSVDALNPRRTIPATRIDAKASVALVLPGLTLVVSP